MKDHIRGVFAPTAADVPATAASDARRWYARILAALRPRTAIVGCRVAVPTRDGEHAGRVLESFDRTEAEARFGFRRSAPNGRPGPVINPAYRLPRGRYVWVEGVARDRPVQRKLVRRRPGTVTPITARRERRPSGALARRRSPLAAAPAEQEGR